MSYRIIQTDKNLVQITRALELTGAGAFPEGAGAGAAISLCRERGASVCLFMRASDKAGADGMRLKVYLIVTLAVSSRKLEREMDDLVSLLIYRLSGLGLFFAPVREEADADFLSDVRLSAPVVSFAREDFARGKNGAYYCPAGYKTAKPLEIDRIADMLLKSPSAGFLMQLTAAHYTAAEIAALASARDAYLGAASSENCASDLKEYLNQASERLNDRLKTASEPRYFLTMATAGDGGSLIRSYMREAGYKSCRVDGYVIDRCLASEDVGFYPLMKFNADHAHSALPPETLSRMSFLVTAQTALSLVSASGRAARLPGVPSPSDGFSALPDALTREDGIFFGETPVRREKVYMPLKAFTRHGMIVGMPGSGKTTFGFMILNELWKKKIPFLVIEPAKCEYRALIDVIKDVRILTPGRADLSPMPVNIFLPPKGITLAQYRPVLIDIFKSAVNMRTPLDVIFSNAINECYARHGWRQTDTRDSKNIAKFGLVEFIRVFSELVEESDYDPESKGNLRSGGVMRLQSLIENNPDVFDTDKSVSFEELLTRPTVIELEHVRSAEQKALIVSVLLQNLRLVIASSQKCDGNLKNVILLEEAHAVLSGLSSPKEAGDANAADATVHMFQSMTSELRAFGTGLIFTDQSPTRLTRPIAEQTDVRAVLRESGPEDRALLSRLMGYGPDEDEMVRTAPVGRMLIGCSYANEPVPVQSPNAEQLLGLRKGLVEDAEIARRDEGAYKNIPPFSVCECAGCDAEIRREADFLARRWVSAHKSAAPEEIDLALDGILAESRLPASAGLRKCVKIHCARRTVSDSPAARPSAPERTRMENRR